MKLIHYWLLFWSMLTVELNGQNLIPNNQFNLGEDGATPNLLENCDQQDNINGFILDWKRALNSYSLACDASSSCPSPDWFETGCPDAGIEYPVIDGNRWIHAITDGQGYDMIQEGLRVKLTGQLHAGESYTLTYWILTQGGHQEGGHDFRAYLCNRGHFWDIQPFWAWGRNRILVEVFRQSILPHAFAQPEIVPSPYQPVAHHWHQRRTEFTVPSDMDDLEHIILIPRNGTHHFDDPILTLGGCNDPLIIDDTTFRPGVHHPYHGTPIQIGYNGAVNSDGATLTFISPVEVQINEIYVPGYEAFHVYNAPCDCESPVANPGSAAIICANDPPYQLGGTSQEWMTYNWTCEPSSGTNYLSSTTISDPVLTPPTTGNHQLVYTLTVTNTCGESFSEEIPIIIVNTPDDTPELSVNFFTTEWPVRIWMLPDQWMETISIELYNYGGSTPVQTWDLQAFQDFQPGEDFYWEFPPVLPVCEGYTIKVRGRNMCSMQWSVDETVTVEPFGGFGIIEQLSNVVSMTSPPPNNAITLVHTGFVHYRLRVFDGHSGLNIHDVSRPIVSNVVALWDGLHNRVENPVLLDMPNAHNGTYMFILDLTDCNGNIIHITDFWTVLNSPHRLANPNASPEQTGVDGLLFGQFLEGETPFNTGLQIVPNPNTGTFTLAAGIMNQVMIMEASGKLVQQMNGPFQGAVQISGLSPGLYIVRVQMADGRVENAKVVVN